MDFFSALIIFGQLALSAALGGVIGVEREKIQKATGVRTLALVAMGSTLFTVMSRIGIPFAGDNVDPTRIAAQVVVGIGFIGAGIIVLDEHKVHGLTTAAGLWVTAAIGIAVGFEYYWVAVFSTVLVIFILYVVRKFKLDEKLKGNEIE